MPIDTSDPLGISSDPLGIAEDPLGISQTSTATTPPPSPVELKPESARNIHSITATTSGGPPLQLPDAKVALTGAVQEISEGFGDVLTHPSPIPTPFPEIGKDEHWAVAAGKEAVNLAVEVPKFFTTSLGIGAAAAGVVAPTAVAAVFTVDLLKSLGEQFHSTYKNWSTMTPSEKAVAVTDMVGTGVFARLTAKHTVKGAERFAESKVPKGQGIETPTTPLTQQQILDAAAKQLSKNVQEGELVGGEGSLRLEVDPKPNIPPDLYIFAPQTAEAVKETIKPIEVIPEAIEFDLLKKNVSRNPTQEARFQELKSKSDSSNSREAFARAQAEADAAKAASANALKETGAAAGTPTDAVVEQPAAVKPVETVGPGDLAGPGGAAVSTEFQPARTFTTKTTVEQINKERKERGLGPLEEHEVFSNKQAVADAKNLMDENPDAAEQILARLREKPETALEPTERAVMVIHRAELLNSYYRALKTWREHFEGDDIARAAQAAETVDFYSKKLSETESLVSEGGAGTAAGRSLQAIKIGISEDYSLDMMTLKAMKAKGEALTPEEGSAIVNEHEKLTARIKELEAELSKEKEKGKTTDSQDAVDDAVKVNRARQKKEKSAGTKRDLEAEQAEAVAHLKESFIENDASLAGEETTIRKLMELLVEREGITDRLKMEDRVHEILTKEVDPTITREEAMDLMSNYGKSKLPSPEFAKKTVRDIVAQVLSVRKLLDYFKGERPKLTGQLRDAPSDIQRGLVKMVNEAKKAFKLEGPTDNARAVKSALDAINTRLKNRISDLKQEIATRQKIIRDRQPSPYNEETLRMRAEVAELEKAHKEIFGKTELTPEQRLALLEKSTDLQIAELERQLKTGEIFPKSKIPFKGDSPKLKAARARLEELKSTREWARESAQPKMEPESKFLLNYLLRLHQREAQYRERIAKGDFDKRVKKQRELSPEVLRAKAEVEAAKQDFHKGLMEFEMARRTKLRRIWDGIKQTTNAFVNIVSSYDLSAPRQMFLALLANSSRLAFSPLRLLTKRIPGPIESAKLVFIPLGRMFKALSSEKRSQDLEQWRKTRANATSGADKIAEIQYTDLHTYDFTKWEENAHSVLDQWATLPLKTGNLAKTTVTAPVKIASKGVRASNRAFITALNTQRAMLFDHLLETNFKDRAPTEADLKVLGNLVNVSTGRGKLSRGVAKATGTFMWSPSLFAARLQVLIGQPLWGGGKLEGSARARLIVAKEYARWLVSGAALLATSRMFDDKEERDLTSSDVGKIVRGNTRIDVWEGFQQFVVLSARVSTGKNKSSDTDKNRNIAKYGTGEVIWNFFKNKARPDIAAIVKVTIAAIDSGKPAKDVRITMSDAAKSAVPIPLAIQDVISVMKDRGMTEGAILQVLAEFGVGVNTYEDKEKQK